MIKKVYLIKYRNGDNMYGKECYSIQQLIDVLKEFDNSDTDLCSIETFYTREDNYD